MTVTVTALCTHITDLGPPLGPLPPQPDPPSNVSAATAGAVVMLLSLAAIYRLCAS